VGDIAENELFLQFGKTVAEGEGTGGKQCSQNLAEGRFEKR
jgi:hypothetical protein